MCLLRACLHFFFFNDTATTEIYTLSLHDALPILARATCPTTRWPRGRRAASRRALSPRSESTRLNSSHTVISYAVFCLKKKKHRHQAVMQNSLANAINSCCRLAQIQLREFFFFNDTATTEIYTLSLHDALPTSSSTIAQPCSACHHRRRTSSLVHASKTA